MKIKETDFLWKFYKRWHEDDNDYGIAESPRNLCRYFWHSIFGMLAWFFVDVPAYVIAPLFLTLSCLGTYYYIANGHAVIGPLFLIAAVISAIFGSIKVGEFLRDNTPEWLSNVFACLFVFAVAEMIFTMLAQGVFVGRGPFQWILLLYGFLLMLGVAVALVAIIGLFGAVHCINQSDNSTVIVVKSYISAVKNKVCPFVESPWDKKDGKP